MTELKGMVLYEDSRFLPKIVYAFIAVGVECMEDVQQRKARPRMSVASYLDPSHVATEIMV